MCVYTYTHIIICIIYKDIILYIKINKDIFIIHLCIQRKS